MNPFSSLFNRRIGSGFAGSKSKKSRKPASCRKPGLLGEPLEPRLLFSTTVAGGTINTNVSWTSAGSPYNLNGYVNVGPGGSLTIGSGITVTGSPLTIESGGSLSATGTHFSDGFTAQQGAAGSVSGSAFNGSTEFDNTGIILSGDSFSTNPDVFDTYVPTVIGNGNTFTASTTIEIEGGTLSTPLTLPVVTNVSKFNFNGYQTVGSGGVLTVNSGVTLDGSPLTIASGGSIAATGANISCSFTAKQGTTGSLTNDSLTGTSEFDNTGLTLSSNTFSSNPYVFDTYAPELIGNGDTFAASTILEIEGGTLSTPLTLPVVTNISEYSLNGYHTVGSGGVLTINSGVTMAGSPLTVASGGSITANDVHFSCAVTAQEGATGSVSGSFFNGSMEFDNTGVTLGSDSFSTDPDVFDTYIPTLIGNGNLFVTGTILDIEDGTLSTPLTLPVVANVSQYSFNGYQTVGSGGSLTVDSGVTLAGSPLTLASGGNIAAAGAHISCGFTAQKGATGTVTGSAFDDSSEFDNTGISLATDSFTTNPSVADIYVPTLVGGGNTFATGTILNIEGGTLSTALTLTAVPNISKYDFDGYHTVGSGGELTVDSGVTLSGSPLTVDSGATISANGVAFDCDVALDGASSDYIQNSDFTEVSSQGNGGPIPLSGNWWGTTMISTIESEIDDQNDNSNLPAVTYQPILTIHPTASGNTAGISLATSTSTANLGNAVTLTATVGGSVGAPGGVVSFVDGELYLGTAAISNGVASIVTTALPQGTNQVTAVYGGDLTFAGVTSAAANVTVNLVTGANASTTTLASSTNYADQGSNVTLTATVTGSGTPTGTVTFMDGSTDLGSAAVASNGVAQISLTTLSVGSHSIVASFSGDITFAASTSSPATSVVITEPGTAAATTSTLTSSANIFTVGNTCTLTCNVASASSSGPTPTGTVTIYENGTSVSTQTLYNGIAVVTFTGSAVANNAQISFAYSGDSSYAASTSNTISQTYLPLSQLGATITRAVVPSFTIAGQPFKAKLPVAFKNTASTLIGIYTIVLYIDTSTGGLSGNQVALETVNKSTSLKKNKAISLTLSTKTLPVSLPAGTYYLLAEITDPDGNKNLVNTQQTIAVSAPVIDFSASPSAVKPASIKPGKSGSVVITLINTGNVSAISSASLPLTITLYPTTDDVNATDGIVLGTFTEHLNIKPGKSAKYTLHFKVPTTLPADGYDLYGSISFDGMTDTVTSPFIVS